jgi:hypothetical protein
MAPPVRLRAAVRRVTGATTHRLGVAIFGGVQFTKLPDPEIVELVEEDDGVYLLRLDADGRCVADTWHETVAMAKAQAKFEYCIEDDDWQDIAPKC